MSEKRPLTSIEIRIIDRDATEQRALSAELNGRVSLFIGLVAIAAAVATAGLSRASFQVFVIVALIVIVAWFHELLWGENYAYPRLKADWVGWMDANAAADPDMARREEQNLKQDYYRDLMKASWQARTANQRKSDVKFANLLSLMVIILILILGVLERVA